MDILVINGSPKGKNSITLHTCLFLEKKFPGYKFDYLDAGQRIKVLVGGSTTGCKPKKWDQKWDQKK